MAPKVSKELPLPRPVSRSNSSSSIAGSFQAETRRAKVDKPLQTDNAGFVDEIEIGKGENAHGSRLEATKKGGEEMHSDLQALKDDPKLKRAFLAKKIAPAVMALSGFVSLVLLFAAPHLMIVPGLLFAASVGAETVAASYMRRRTKEVAPKFIRDFEASKEGLKEEQAALLNKKMSGDFDEKDQKALTEISAVLEHGDFLTNDLAMPFTFSAFLNAKNTLMAKFKTLQADKTNPPA